MTGVVVSYLFPLDVSGRFCDSLTRLIRHDAQGPGYVVNTFGGLIATQTGPRVAEARSQVCDQFLGNYPGSDWLLMLDSDMTFDPDLVEQLVAHAHPERVPILGGLCFAGGRSHRMFPTIYREVESEDGVTVAPVMDYPRDRLLKVGATGGACLLIHRQVLVAMAHPYPKGFGTLADGRKNPYPWFVEGLTGARGEPLGEDVSFCRKARMLGIPTHVHTGIKLGHVKAFELDEAEFDRYVAEGGTFEGIPTKTRAERRRAARELARVS
jgi:hypothetical protein